MGIGLRTHASPGRAWIVASELVVEEWSSHAQHTKDEVEAHIKTTDRQVQQVLAAAQRLPILAQLSRWDLTSLKLPDELHNIAAGVLGCTEVLRSEQSHILSAHSRLINGYAPAKKGKQEYKDCVIVEQYLSLCRELRLGGLSTWCGFVSSNVNDYGTPAGLLPPLDADFAAVGLTFAVNFDAAFSLIR